MALGLISGGTSLVRADLRRPSTNGVRIRRVQLGRQSDALQGHRFTKTSFFGRPNTGVRPLYAKNRDDAGKGGDKDDKSIWNRTGNRDEWDDNEEFLRADGRRLAELVETYDKEAEDGPRIFEGGIRSWFDWARPRPIAKAPISEKRVRSLITTNESRRSARQPADVVEGREREREYIDSSGRVRSISYDSAKYGGGARSRYTGRKGPFDELRDYVLGPQFRTARFFLRLGFTVIVFPVIFSTFCRLTLISPVLESRLSSENWFQITEEQEEEVAVKVERVRQRMQYSELMGRAPEISGSEFLDELRVAGEKFESEERLKNKEVITNVLADSLSALLLGLAITFNRRRVDLLRNWLGERFLSLEASTQAFTLLLVADILVGYHSSDGWITAINLSLGHYGIHEHEEFTSIFVATVPVSLDVTFKYWVFKTLRKIAPSTQVILSEIEE
eukprot:CAMPEP_0118922428 /NCGR_PEP_ID=MMETSP1169-20130426/1354_1 /TAXON_ID=36882 /ORGANISM="Pyramimonas obovata, Strain CCMP722" /LENGTH=446 /DNA_ID=CAMNT_0006863291 /DNA_START=284 /DNA_END=1624 /DNA_ORIENTATION=+